MEYLSKERYNELAAELKHLIVDIPLGGETTLGFNLTVFVGARFGLFCYATRNDSDGYADFDWFSTESKYDESLFYPETFEGFNEDMLTATDLKVNAESMEIMVAGSTTLTLTATFRDGHTENVAAKASYATDAMGVVEIKGGQIRGLCDGTANITATYIDPMGTPHTATFSVRSTFFPFGKEYINTSLFSQGTYTESTRTFKPGQWGQMGWEYTNGADFSPYKFLVIKLAKVQNCDAHLNIFTAASIWSDCCESPSFGSKKQIVINLTTAKYTSGDKKGKPLDTKNIRIVDFWANGNGTIVVDDMYLTNNDDYSPETHNAVTDLTANKRIAVYSLSGLRLRSSADPATLTTLPAGLYIIDGKKVMIKH